MGIKITKIPFDSKSYVIQSNHGDLAKDVKSWLDQNAPDSYVVTGENIVTFLDPRAETMFMLRWLQDN
jgi:hypothetical protein